MVKTPQTYTFVAGPNQQLPPVCVAAKHLKVISCTQPTVLIGFDGDRPEIMYPDYDYAAPGPGFGSITIQDASGAGCTVILTVSAEPVIGQANANLAAIAATVAALLAITDPGGTLTPIADTLLGATGGAGTLIKAANASRKNLVIVGDATMTGIVYLGKDATVSATNKIGVLTQYGSWSEAYTGAIYGVGNDALEKVCGYELS